METDLYSIFLFSSFAFGCVIASFLNVVIWRVPRGESIVSPPSHCPRCDSKIKWYQNIPVVSYLALGGRCSNCKAHISLRYPTVELLGGLLFLATSVKFGMLSVALWIWVALMIIGTFIDIDHKLLPDFVTVGGMILGLVINGAISCFPVPGAEFFFSCQFFKLPILNSIVGLAVGFGSLLLVRQLGTMAFRREAMGMGDVFLMGAVGAMFGPVAVLFSIMFSAVLGSVVGVALILFGKSKTGTFIEIPYGPYIYSAVTLWMFYGPELVHMYLSLLKI